MKATTTEVQNNFGKYLKIAMNEDVIITRNGKEIACLSTYEKDSKNKLLICEGSAAYTYEKPFKVTFDEFIRLVEDSVNRYEYINGVIYLLASPTHMHQNTSAQIYGNFFNWFRGKKCRPYYAPFDLSINVGVEKNVVQPDILVICDHENIDQKGKYHGIPSLVVEILSPSTRTKDLTTKLELYMKGGIQEYWVVNPEAKKIDIYAFKEKEISEVATFMSEDTAKSFMYKGLEISLTEIGWQS